MALGRAWLLVASLGVMACGARSVLDLVDGAGGAGGDGGAASGGGAAGGSGPGGGGAAPPVECQELVLGLPPVALEWPDAFFHSARPMLVPLEGPTVALVNALVPVEAPGIFEFAIGQRELLPWDNLASSEGVLLADAGGRGAIAARTPTVGLYALAARSAVQLDTLRVSRSVDPTVPYTPQPPGVDLDSVDHAPVFLTALEGAMLAGHRLSTVPNGDEFLFFSRVAEALELSVGSETGCAQPIAGGLQAQAVAVEDGAVIAVASGREGGSCFDDDGIPGPPRYLQTGHLDAETLTLTVAEDEEFSEPLVYLAVVGEGDARWVLYQTDGSTAFAPPSVIARRLDAEGVFVGEPVEALGSGYVGPFAAAAMGEGFVFAYFDAFDPSTPTLLVRRIDGSGELVTEGSVGIDAFLVGPDLSMVVSPDRDSVLLSWAQFGDGGQDPVALARFDCIE